MRQHAPLVLLAIAAAAAGGGGGSGVSDTVDRPVGHARVYRVLRYVGIRNFRVNIKIKPKFDQNSIKIL